MRILVVHNRYLERGGEDETVDAEVALLRARGHEVDVLLRDNREAVITHKLVGEGRERAGGQGKPKRPGLATLWPIPKAASISRFGHPFVPICLPNAETKAP